MKIEPNPKVIPYNMLLGLLVLLDGALILASSFSMGTGVLMLCSVLLFIGIVKLYSMAYLITACWGIVSLAILLSSDHFGLIKLLHIVLGATVVLLALFVRQKIFIYVPSNSEEPPAKT